ncbi:MAG: mechanosensitive ion channel domain-containing protein [Nitrososphaerales archaeon]
MGTRISPFAQVETAPGIVLLLAAITLYLIAALILSLFARALARPIVLLGRRLPGRGVMAPSREKTLESLIASLISLVGLILAAMGIFSLFVDSERLIWIIGLFSAAFGLGARAFVADILAGTRFIFRNTFTIGEKVELNVAGVVVEGTVEEVNVTNTLVRAQSGEAYVVPNGDISVIRNFSRAPYSSARIKLLVKSAQLGQAMNALAGMSDTVQAEVSEIIEPFQVLSTSDTMGSKVELTVVAHCAFAKAATVKLRLMDLIYQRLCEAGVEVVD